MITLIIEFPFTVESVSISRRIHDIHQCRIAIFEETSMWMCSSSYSSFRIFSVKGFEGTICSWYWTYFSVARIIAKHWSMAHWGQYNWKYKKIYIHRINFRTDRHYYELVWNVYLGERWLRVELAFSLLICCLSFYYEWSQCIRTEFLLNESIFLNWCELIYYK